MASPLFPVDGSGGSSGRRRDRDRAAAGGPSTRIFRRRPARDGLPSGPASDLHGESFVSTRRKRSWLVSIQPGGFPTGPSSLLEAEGDPPRLPVSGEVVGSLAAGGDQNRRTRVRSVPAGRVRGYQSEAESDAGDQVPKGRGTAEQWINESKNALNWTRLSYRPGATPVVLLGLQHWELLAATGAAPAGADVDANNAAGEADQDRGQGAASCPR
jgi:hypothetical protein